jgi:hypothetical protein
MPSSGGCSQSLFSLGFSTAGELVFAAIYILSLLKRHEVPLIISFLLLIDGYIFYRNLVTLPRFIQLPFSTPQLEIADGISTILINAIVIAAILYAVHHFDRQLQALKQTLYTDPAAGASLSAIRYSLVPAFTPLMPSLI